MSGGGSIPSGRISADPSGPALDACAVLYSISVALDHGPSVKMNRESL